MWIDCREQQRRTTAWSQTRPWWTFIPLTNYFCPLLHCDIGVGNVIFELLRDIINKFIEKYAPGEESIRSSVIALKNIIDETAKERNEWDKSPNGNIWKKLQRAVNAHQKRRRLIVASEEESDEREVAYHSNVIKLKKHSIRSRLHRQQAQKSTTLIGRTTNEIT
jgi:hypothetical protein